MILVDKKKLTNDIKPYLGATLGLFNTPFHLTLNTFHITGMKTIFKSSIIGKFLCMK